MEIGKTLYLTKRKEWRAWLARYHSKEREIWLVYYNKASGIPRLPYNDAVEEALCYGWIDSTVKNVDAVSFAQRFTPRRLKSGLSELNRERVHRLIKAGKMTMFGLAKIIRHLQKEFELPRDILEAIKADKKTRVNFLKFPEYYRAIRVAFIAGARRRPEEFQRMPKHSLEMTKKGKKFGMVQ